jgi:hypothetical protein
MTRPRLNFSLTFVIYMLNRNLITINYNWSLHWIALHILVYFRQSLGITLIVKFIKVSHVYFAQKLLFKFQHFNNLLFNFTFVYLFFWHTCDPYERLSNLLSSFEFIRDLDYETIKPYLLQHLEMPNFRSEIKKNRSHSCCWSFLLDIHIVAPMAAGFMVYSTQ